MIGKKINQLATELAPASTDLTIIGNPTTGVSKKITLAQLGAIFSGAVSFYTNLAAFPTPGTTDVIYCAKDTQKLYLWSGSAYVEVFPSQALLDTYQLRSEKGNANGYASLDSQGKVPISQLPSSIMEYKGTWNASTNTPTLANGTGDTGDVYICNVAGTVNFGAGAITFAVGDYVIYSGTIWQRSSGAVGTVTSVAASITGNAIGITGSPVTTSGTLAFAFAGNSTQYVNGAGNLVTFPGVINEAQNLITEVYNKTGATLTKGTVVYINGGQGNLPAVTKALATGDSTSAQTYGIVRNDITNNNNGYVVVAGRISDLDTQAYTEGTQLYLSPTTAGTFTSTKPYAPNHLVYVGIVVRAHPTQGVIEVKIQNGYELDELHNVAAQSPTNNDGLFWEASTSLWKNKSIANILGYTPQAQLNGTGFVKASGTSISYDNSTYVTIDTFETITASKNFAVGLSLGSAGGTNQASVFQNTSSLFSGSSGISVFGFNSSNNIYFGKGSDNGGVLQWNNSTVRYYTLPDATGTIALVGGAGVGTVTSVSALTIGTSGTDISSTVANSTTTPVITLNVPTASATNRGALSSADWTKFNNNIPAGTPTSGDYVFYNGSNLAYRNFIATSPLSYNSSTATFSISQASGSANGFLSSTDWTTFNNKQNALTNPVTGTGTTNYLPKFTGTSTIGNSQIFDNGTNVGIGTASPSTKLEVSSSDLNTIFVTNPDTSGATTGSGIGFKAYNGTSVTQFAGIILTANSWSFGTYASRQLNIGCDGAGGIGLRTANSAPIIFYTGGSFGGISPESMRLNASGNLSIGNTNDSFKLDVTGTGRFTSSLTTTQLISLSASGSAALFLKDGSANNKWEIGHITNSLYFYNYTRGGNDLILNGSTGAATFSSSVTSAGITSTGTNTMLSASSSTAGLVVRGGSSIGTASLASGQIFVGQTPTYRMSLAYDDNTGYMYIDNLYDNANSNIYIRTRTNGTPVNALTILGGGNVGIGTTSPNNNTISAFDALTIGKTSTSSSALVFTNGSSTIWGFNYANASKYTLSSSTDLAFETGASWSEKMRITSGGSVLLGTTANASDVRLQVAPSGGAGSWISGTFSGTGGTNKVVLGSYNGVASIGGHNSALSAWANLSINFDGGNVGIGNLSPSYTLDVSGTGRFTSDVKVKTLEITNVGTESTSSGISTYMEITVNGQNYVIPLHGMP